MLGIGHFPELIIVLVVALIVFGPGKLPEIGRSIGQSIRYFRQSTSELERTFSGAFEDATAMPPQTPGMTAAPQSGATLEQPLPAYDPVTAQVHEPVSASVQMPVAEPPAVASLAPAVHEASAAQAPALEEHAAPVAHVPAPASTVPEPVAHFEATAPTAGISAEAVHTPSFEPIASTDTASPPTSGGETSAATAPAPRQRTRRVRKTAVTTANDSAGAVATEGVVAVAEHPNAEHTPSRPGDDSQV